MPFSASGILKPVNISEFRRNIWQKRIFIYTIEGQPVKVSEEVYREYKHAEEKERYFMKRLKKGKFVVDPEKQTVEYVPSREASYEHLWKQTGISLLRTSRWTVL